MAERYLDAETVMRLLGGSAAIPKAGDLVAGKYRILGAIGEGGVGTILEAHHELLDKDVALKLIALEPTPNTSAASLAERFLIEARAAAKVESPHVARVMDVGKLDSGAPFMVMERLEGCNLEELLTLEGTLSVEDTVDYVMQALQGLAHAHVLGVVHRDLKPANLFLARQPDGSSVIKIVDFGIAMLLDDAGRRQVATRVTGSGVLVGSPLYMSPEQVRDEEHIDHRTDIWSVGVVLYELLTGKLPFGSGKWTHLVESIEQSFRARLVRMTGPGAFTPMAVKIEMPPEAEPESELPPEKPEPNDSRAWMLVVFLILAVAGVIAWGVHANLF